MLFFSRASGQRKLAILRGATGLVGAFSLIGCGIVGSGGSDTASTRNVGDELITAAKVDEAKILVADVDPVLAFAGTGSNSSTKESDLSLPDCATVPKGKYNSALFLNPNALRRSVRDSQGISRRSGYFSSFDAAKEAVSKSLEKSLASGIICLKSARYSTSLKLDKPSLDSWSSALTFSGTKGGAEGYQSKLNFVVQFDSETIKATVENVTGKFDYHYVSSIKLSSENGDEDLWKFAPSKAAKERIAANLNKYLVQWKKANPVSKKPGKVTTVDSEQEKQMASCDNAKTPRIFAYVNAEMSKVFPGVKPTKEQLTAKKGFDGKNYVYAEVKIVTEGKANMKAEEGLEEFSLEQSNQFRSMTYTLPIGTPGHYELHLTPFRNGQRQPHSTIVKFALRHVKDEDSGNCSAKIDDQDVINGDNGLGASVLFN